jgi:DNA-binding NtrC family response regulator
MPHEQLIPSPPVGLVVDPEPLIQIDTADVVADEGFDVIEARTADEAYRFLKYHPSLRLVIIDTQRGGAMNCSELASEVNRRSSHIGVVVASGATLAADDDLPPSAIFMGKPISPDVVHAAIEEYCGRCHAR